MQTKQLISDFLKKHEINVPVGDFVEITSNIYHKYEAKDYDNFHFGIKLSEPYWERTLLRVQNLVQEKDSLKLLDFGCGTGFATEQILKSRLKNKCSQITCYDLSQDMVAECKKKFGAFSEINFLSDREGFEELKKNNGNFDVIICNALIHHILDHETLFELFDDSLTKDGILIIGHEPNRSFYQNIILQGVSKVYRLYKKGSNKITRKLLLKNSLPKSFDLCDLTYKHLLKEGYISKTFPKQIIQKFVDIHVPMSTLKKQPWGELGFNKDFFQQVSKGKLQVIEHFSYNHIKDQQAYKSKVWIFISKGLQFLFPKDGADVIFMIQKK